MSDRDRLSLATALATLMTSSALFAVFLGARWVPAVAGVIAVVAAGSMAARALRLPAGAAPVLIGAAVTGYVTLLFASGPAVAGFLPGPGAVRALRLSARTGFDDIATLAPPVPSRPGLLLITVVGVALVALVADILATTVRRPPAAGIPLLALFAVPAALAPAGSGVVPFGLAVTGYLLLLAADGRSRLARWGRPLGASGPTEPVSRLTAVSYGEEPPTGAMGRRIGLTAIGLALVVPIVVPTMSTSLFAGGGGAGVGSGRGGNSVTTYNPIVRLHDQLTSPQTVTLLTLRTSEAKPTGYLRMAGLDVFDGRTWSQSSLRATPADRVSQALVLPSPPAGGEAVTTALQVSDRLDARWLPLPYQPTAIRVDGDWRYESRTGTVFSTRNNVRGQAYQAVSAALRADPKTLDSSSLDLADKAAFASYTTYPADLPLLIRQTADRVVSKAGATTAYQRAVAIQQYFRSGAFTYSLRVPGGNGDDAIVNFLRAKQGFCEQYAATMALFARMEGIPARVAVGFTYGERSADGTYVITTHDAHAWPELYFAKAGWLPFEPTPVAGRGEAVAPSYTTGTAGGTRTQTDLTPTGAAGDLQERRFGNRQESSDASLTQPAENGPASGRSWTRWLGWLGLAPFLLAVPAIVRAVTRRRRWRSAGSYQLAAHAAWADVRDDARDLGMVWPASASPRGVAAWLRSRVTLPAEVSAALDAIVRAEERARYQRPDDPGALSGGAGLGQESGRGAAAELRHGAASLRSTLRAQTSAGRRWRARVLPPSGTDQLRRLTSRAAVAGDRYDRNLARWIRSLVHRRATAR